MFGQDKCRPVVLKVLDVVRVEILAELVRRELVDQVEEERADQGLIALLEEDEVHALGHGLLDDLDEVLSALLVGHVAVVDFGLAEEVELVLGQVLVLVLEAAAGDV